MMLNVRLAACCVALALAVSTASFSEDKPSHNSTSITSINGVETYQWTHDDHRIKIRTEGGKLELTDDWTGIARLSPGTKVRIEEDDGRTEQRLDVEAGSDGRPVYTWTIDGKKRAFDAAGRQWLQGMLLRLVRGSGYDADRRVAWFLKNQGPNGLLAEISQIPGDYVKSLYFQKLFARRGLGADVVERALRQAGKEIGSDYELAQTLIAAASATGTQALTEPSARAYAEAARSIGSDYEQRRALSTLLAKGRPTPAVLAVMLQAAQEIGSDYELAELLTGVPPSALGDAAVRNAYIKAAEGIGSDYEHHRALSAAVASGKLSGDSLIAVLRSAQGIGSDYERASLLVEIAGKYSLAGAARDAYVQAASSIGSKYERGRAEEALRSGR
jgi:alkylhydroperoxidase family enzyme